MMWMSSGRTGSIIVRYFFQVVTKACRVGGAARVKGHVERHRLKDDAQLVGGQVLGKEMVFS